MSAFRLTFGIDPGLTGAVVTLLDGVAGPMIDMPTQRVGDWGEIDARALALFIREQRAAHPGAYVSACIEKVGAMPGDGGTSAFRFGETSGAIKAILSVLGIPCTRAIPAVWKRSFGLTGQPKDAARVQAIRRFPEVSEQLKRKKDNGRADALWIALWHEQTQMGGVDAPTSADPRARAHVCSGAAA